MKIFYVNATSGAGSTGNICKELATAYTLSGNECKIFYGNGKDTDKNSIKISSDFSVKVHALLSRVTGLQGYYSTCATNKLIKTIKVERPDIVHIHNVHANFLNTYKLFNFLSRNDFPTILTLHDCNLYTGKCTHYTDANCNRWQYGCGNCPQLKKDIPSLFFDKTAQMLKDKKTVFNSFKRLGIIAVSDWVKSEAQKSILKNAKIKRIYNWIDKDVFKPHPFTENEFTILLVSAKWGKSMPKYKDVLKLSNKLYGNIKIKLVGKIEKGLLFPNNVEVIDYISSPKEMAKLYNEASVYVHLSSEDSFGKVIAESLACGTPVIVYNSTACPELVNEGSGYVVDVRDIDAVCERIEEIRKNGKKFYSQNCVKQSEKFYKYSLINETFEFYKEIIGN